MSVGPLGSHDITLSNDESAAPATTIDLKIAEDKDGNKRWSERRMPPLAPRQSTGPVSFQHTDPLVDFIWQQDNWSDGALRPYYRDLDNRYATADNVDLRWEGVAALGMQLTDANSFLLRNAGAEETDSTGAFVTSGWIAGTDVTLSSQADAARSGTRGFRLVTAAVMASGSVLLTQNISNPTVYADRAIMAGGYLRRTVGTESGIFVRLTDSITSTSTAATAPGTAATGGSGTAWSDPSNALSSNDVRATATISAGGSTQNLLLDNFGFAIPAGRTILGISVAVELSKTGTGNVHDGSIRLLRAGTASGNDKARASTTLWDDTTDQVVTYGSATDMWGTTWTEADIEHADFGVSISAAAGTNSVTARIDAVTITVSYSGAPVATDSATVTSSTYTYSATTLRTVATATVGMTVEIVTSAATTVAHTYEIDDLFLFPAGGVEVAGSAEHNGNLYALFGRVIAQYDATNQKWDAVLIHATAVATSIANAYNTLWVAFGLSTAYQYGSGTTWTASTKTATNANFANFFVTVGHGTGSTTTERLWKSQTANTVAYVAALADADNTNVNAWTTIYTVGNSDHIITGLYAYGGSIVVGKEDGFWRYLRYQDATAVDFFDNSINDFERQPHAENFDQGTSWRGWLYLTTSQQGFIRYNGQVIEDVSSFLLAPRLSSGRFGGRIRAIAATPQELFLMIDSTTADTVITKTTSLLSIRNHKGTWQPHVLATPTIGVIDSMAVHYDGTSNYLHAFGRLYNSDLLDYVAAPRRWRLPDKTAAPYQDATPRIARSGTFDTSIWHGNLLETPKAFLWLTIWAEDVSSTQTIQVQYGLDGAANTTTSLTTFNGTGRIQTAYFNSVTTPETNAIGRTIQLRFTFTTASTTSPKLYGFALHSTLNPIRLRVWDLYVEVGRGTIGTLGQEDPRSKNSMVASLNTLETQTYPVYLTHDLDGDGINTTSRVKIIFLDREPNIGSSAFDTEGPEIYHLVLQETITGTLQVQ